MSNDTHSHKIVIEIEKAYVPGIWYMMEIIKQILPNIGAVYMEFEVPNEFEIDPTKVTEEGLQS